MARTPSHVPGPKGGENAVPTVGHPTAEAVNFPDRPRVHTVLANGSTPERRPALGGPARPWLRRGSPACAGGTCGAPGRGGGGAPPNRKSCAPRPSRAGGATERLRPPHSLVHRGGAARPGRSAEGGGGHGPGRTGPRVGAALVSCGAPRCVRHTGARGRAEARPVTLRR